MTRVSPELPTFRNDKPYPFCPGCGHSAILDRLDEALRLQGLDPHEVVIVTDIGCSGLSDQYFTTSAFHGLHGRSLTYATGIKLARPDLKVVVIMGDGGTGIGGAHLLNAARRNIGLTVLVMNNFNFGMTGGQHSTTTPAGALTATTPGGNLERPLDLCATVGVNGAGYVYRGTSFDKDLPERIAEAMAAECFALLDVWELCTAHFVPRNKASRKTLGSTLEALGLETGVLYRRELPEYAAAYAADAARVAGRPALAPRPLAADFTSPLERRTRLVLAGSAGAKVRTAASLLARAAIRSDLWVTQRDDYPITVKTGHSIAELILDREPIEYTGITRPDGLVLMSADGLAKSKGHLARMGPEDHVFTTPDRADLVTDAQITVLDPAAAKVGRNELSLFLAAAAALRMGVLSLDALRATIEAGPAAYAPANLAAVEAAAAATG